MSAEATGWVFRHSPLTGVEFTIHLAIADSVNDQNDNEFWMKQGNLATKARCGRQKVNETLKHMVELGLLEEVDSGPDESKWKHQGRRFRFAMPVVSDDTPDSDVAPDDIRCAVRRHLDVAPDDIQGTQALSQAVTQPSRDARFDEFWDAFGHKVDLKNAQKAWVKAIKRADPVLIISRAKRYRQWCLDTGTKQKYAQGWLNGERWEDDIAEKYDGLWPENGALTLEPAEW